MERSYQEFLRRRGIWCVAEMFRQQGRDTVSVAEFVLALTRFFEVNRCFAEWDEDSQDTGLLAAVSKSNAWVAVLNEMFNARRSTSLVSLGVLYFEYTKNDGFASAFQDEFGIPEADARALWELLVQDGIFTGALYTSDQALTAAEREYVFFSPVEKKLHLMKTAADSKHSWISGWRGRKRSNGNYYVNSKPVSYTHLEVYKRQLWKISPGAGRSRRTARFRASRVSLVSMRWEKAYPTIFLVQDVYKRQIQNHPWFFAVLTVAPFS